MVRFVNNKKEEKKKRIFQLNSKLMEPQTQISTLKFKNVNSPKHIVTLRKFLVKLKSHYFILLISMGHLNLLKSVGSGDNFLNNIND